jgi:peptide/nickel transport system ATP-binding protein
MLCSYPSRPASRQADPSNPPSGCYFHPRCNYARENCKKEVPALRALGDGHSAACHYSEELGLHGAVMG